VRLTSRLLCAVICALTVRADDVFLGPVPVQYVKPGSTITLDFHRFYQPTKTSQFITVGADALQVSFDRKTQQLQVKVESAAKRYCPVDTGLLRSSIHHEVGIDGRGLFARIGSDVEYALYVEMGTRRMAGQPYLRPALVEGNR